MPSNKKNLLKSFALIPALIALGCSVPANETTTAPITEADMIEAQQAWINGLLLISNTHAEGGDYSQVAEDIIAGAYNYAAAPVLFKPTLTFGERTFRTTKEGALSYFVGGNTEFPEDEGFALKGWKGVNIDNKVFYVEGNVGLAMGHFTFIDNDGNEITVEKTFGYRRDDDGNLRIILHKSTIPFSPN